MMNAIALDDEPPALLVLENFCAQTPSIRLEKTFTRPQEALRYLRQFPVDLLFLDIQMPSLSGIDFYKAVEQKTRVIFTTAYSEYAVEGFNLSATDYLLKPFTYERFLQAVRKAQEHFEYSLKTAGDAQTWFYVRASYSLVRIAVDDILYLESIDDYLKIHLEQQAPLLFTHADGQMLPRS